MEVFDILIYAITALVLIFVLYQVLLFFFPTPSPVTVLKQALQGAQLDSKLGHLQVLEQPFFPQGITISKADLQTKSNIVSFECIDPKECCDKITPTNTNTKCNKSVSWDGAYVHFNEGKMMATSVRCILVSGVLGCKVYLGSYPAQAEISKVEVLDSKQGVGEVKLTLTNTGPISLVGGKVSLKLYKKASDWVLTDYSLDPKQIDSILPKEKTTMLWSISPPNSGDYKAEFTFDGLESGFDVKDVNFTLDTSFSCKTDNTTPTETIFDSTTQTYQEIHYCSGCTYAYQCATAWNKLTGKQFNTLQIDKAYCTKFNENGAC